MNQSSSTAAISYGGAVFAVNETATLSGCTIKGNRSSAAASGGLGGGISALSAATITVNKASIVTANLASFDDGGIKNSGGSTITVSADSVVSNNMPNDQN